MNGPTLVVLAAGMGSRFGGCKQMTPLGPNGEIILDYSVFDAARAGFSRSVFVIKREMEADFRALMDSMRFPLPYECAFQQADDLPGGFAVPDGRVKPWGTGHAVWAARHLIDGPFGVVGSDDFFGRDTFAKLGGFLARPGRTDAMCIVGFRLRNTLSESGTVSRGICVEENGLLASVTEREKILRNDGKICYLDGDELRPLSEDSLASMNVWGFPAEMFDWMEQDLSDWLRSGSGDPLKREYYLPAFVDRMIHSGKARVSVLATASQWHGVTYRDDTDNVRAALAALHDAGEYPALR